ncbi:hypothetical protein LCGC14_1829330 [marine sediment metagenome]|uniref:Radical SAM core domain-containing protein n=1 Tax=marine sediment metagenome TaxID=412755 RepID=A0A0F9H4P4_9ZZZZ
MSLEDRFKPQQKLLQHYDRVAEWMRTGDTLPVLVEISPTNYCNAKCDWCFYVSGEYKQRHSKDAIEPNALERALTDMTSVGVKAINWTGGGDPSIHPDIDRFTIIAKAAGLRQGMFTNGYRPVKNPSVMDWIRLTITERFTIPKKAVEAYRGKTKLGVNFNLCAENEEHLERLVLEAKEAGVDYFQVRPALADRWDLQQKVEVPQELMRHETEDFKIFLTPYKFEDHEKPHGYETCYGHHFAPFLWHNGDLDVCAYHFGDEDGKDQFTFGNITEESFSEIWEGARRKGMIDEGIPVIPDCQHCCKNHEINKTLSIIKDKQLEDVDFL